MVYRTLQEAVDWLSHDDRYQRIVEIRGRHGSSAEPMHELAEWLTRWPDSGLRELGAVIDRKAPTVSQ